MMRRIFLGALALCFLSKVAVSETVIVPPPVFASGVITDTSIAQSLSGTPAQFQMDTSQYDGMGICDTTTASKGLCTVTVAGKYSVTCSARAGGGTGGTLGSDLLTMVPRKNAVSIPGAAAQINAQILSIAGPTVSLQSSGQSTFAVGDTFSCYVSTSATGLAIVPSSSFNSLSYQYIGP